MLWILCLQIHLDIAVVSTSPFANFDTEHGHFCLLVDVGFVGHIAGVFYCFFPRFFSLNSLYSPTC